VRADYVERDIRHVGVGRVKWFMSLLIYLLEVSVVLPLEKKVRKEEQEKELEAKT